MKVGEVLRLLQVDGWYLVATRGSHRQFKHHEFEPMVTVAGKRSDTIPAGQLASIGRNSEIEELR